MLTSIDDAAKHPYQRVFLWAAVATILLAPLGQIPSLINRSIDPYVASAARTLTKTVELGGVLVVEYKLNRRRLCRTDLDRFIRAVPAQIVVWRERIPGGATPLGESTVTNRIKLASEIEPGEYQLQTTIFSECTEGFHSTLTPMVNFTVVAK